MICCLIKQLDNDQWSTIAPFPFHMTLFSFGWCSSHHSSLSFIFHSINWRLFVFNLKLQTFLEMAYVGFFYLFPSINLNWFWFWCITSFWVLQIWVSLFIVGLQILNFDSVSHSLTSSLYAFLWPCHHFIVNFKQRLAYPHQNSSILRFNLLLLFVCFFIFIFLVWGFSFFILGKWYKVQN